MESIKIHIDREGNRIATINGKTEQDLWREIAKDLHQFEPRQRSQWEEMQVRDLNVAMMVAYGVWNILKLF